MSKHILGPRGEANFDLYPYVPSTVAAWTFVVLFGMGAVVHFVCIFPLRAWFFIPFVLGCIGEAFGYYGRAWSHKNIRNGSPYLLQLMLILASVPLLAASIYMTLGRIIRALAAEDYAVIRISWLTKIYVLIDIGSFACQMMGSAMQSSGDPKGLKTGQTIVMSGLGVQLFAFACFIAIAAVVHRRLNREPTRISKNTEILWRRHIWMLYAVSILIFVRSAFRLIEFVEGSKSAIYNKEAYMYVFDTTLMILVVFGLAVLHPGQLLRAVRRLEASCVAGDEGAFVLIDNHQ